LDECIFGLPNSADFMMRMNGEVWPDALGYLQSLLCAMPAFFNAEAVAGMRCLID